MALAQIKLIVDVAVLSGRSTALLKFAAGPDEQPGWFIPNTQLVEQADPYDASRGDFGRSRVVHRARRQLAPGLAFQGHGTAGHGSHPWRRRCQCKVVSSRRSSGQVCRCPSRLVLARHCPGSREGLIAAPAQVRRHAVTGRRADRATPDPFRHVSATSRPDPRIGLRPLPATLIPELCGPLAEGRPVAPRPLW